MENEVYSNELQHHGTKGMRWGIRRYQNKDGSLTPAGQKRYNKEMEKIKKETAKVKEAERVAANRKKTQSKFDKLDAEKQKLEARKKALKDDDNKKDDDQPTETLEERRARLLKSTDAKELYKYKDDLTYQELNDRVNRIDLENRLQSRIVEEHQKTGMDHVNGMMERVNKGVALYKSIDNAYSAVTNSTIGKTLAKQLGIETPKKEFDLTETWKNRNKLSTQEMMDLNKRLSAERMIETEIKRRNDDAKAAKKAADEKKAAAEAEKAAKKTEKKAQKQVDDYNKRWLKGESEDKVSSTEYSKSGDNLTDAKTNTRVVKDYPAVINSSISAASNSSAYSAGRDYVQSKAGATKLSDADVELIPPDWYVRMERDGRI